MKCRFCGGETEPKVKLKHPKANEEWVVYRCKECGLWQSPLYEEPEEMYNDQNYDPYQSFVPDPRSFKQKFLTSMTEIAYSPNPSFLKNFKRLLLPFSYPDPFGTGKFLKKSFPNETKYKLLDIGCGDGAFLYFLKESLGDIYDAMGVEISKIGYERAKSYGLNVINSEFKKGLFDQESFHIVRSSHSLEHIPNAFEVLKEINRILKPSGIAVIIVPNRNNFARFLFGKYWGWDLPYHIYQFSKKDLQKMLRSAGFEILKIKTFYMGYFMFSLEQAIRKNPFLRAYQMTYTKIPLASVVNYIVSLPFQPIGFGGAITILARKKT